MFLDKPNGSVTTAGETSPAIKPIPEEDFLKAFIRTLHALGSHRFSNQIPYRFQLVGVLHIKWRVGWGRGSNKEDHVVGIDQEEAPYLICPKETAKSTYLPE